MIVVDASAIIEFLLTTPRGLRVASRIAADSATLHAPHLLDLEVAQVLRRFCASGSLSSARAGEALADFVDLDIHRYSHEMLLPRIWDLRDSFTAYDASYLALTEALGGSLLTCDAALADPPGVEAAVDVVR